MAVWLVGSLTANMEKYSSQDWMDGTAGIIIRLDLSLLTEEPAIIINIDNTLLLIYIDIVQPIIKFINPTTANKC